ncbi:MAG TPA: N-acetylmuramoyl-L-alanine amidase family protein [Halanaerobiales bacterium]|nr:N-acetylmuramoyl-L-alanine amidase family protein [Halanaerobiales bacterium]HPZ61980.1 N-acetylmuramoyl-L-alanine amidase family protein [Halanaerobiales bacterium]HQD03297.1 N-acetylmuramoyl-L-alanine amidase family protein [Halanaerobiales bacterium]
MSNSPLRILLYIFLTISLFLSFSMDLKGENIHVYINGQDLSKELEPVLDKAVVYVKARELARLVGAEINWQQSIKTLTINDENVLIKMMLGNPYIQIGNRTIRSKGSLMLIAGHTYLPLEDVAQCLGFLFKREGNSLYLSRPETYIRDIRWQKEGQVIVVEMDNIVPYRINNTNNPARLELELEKAALADDFTDNLSNKNFYLAVTPVEEEARLKLSIISQYPIPFQGDRSLAEDGDNLIINFLPYITGIKWNKDQLEIAASGDVDRPEIMLLTDPRRLVIDIPDLMLSDFDLELANNPWIKDIRVSQFSYDPIILRIVLELYPDRYLHLAEDIRARDKIVLRTTEQTSLVDLAFGENRISFISDNKISPEIFKLKDPDRLVINVLNASRGEGFPDRIDVDNKLLKSIRTSRFNEETIRIVADLKEDIGYSLQEKVLSDGRIMNIILFENSFKEILINDSELKTDLVINFSGEVNYVIKEGANALILDVPGVKITEDYKLPAPLGAITDIKIKASAEGEGIRFEFATGEYENYKVFSSSPATSITLSLMKEEIRSSKISNLIVLDPGHGGFDPGAVGPSGLAEKDINLQIALLAEDILQREGYNVILTRKDDTFISLKDRVEMANKMEALLFVSIHANSANSAYSEGTETFIAPNKVASSQLLADSLQKNLLKELNRLDRGVKKENFYVIKYTNMPAALVEVAFVSNPHEESLLASNLFKEKAARAIAHGIMEYLQKINNGR